MAKKNGFQEGKAFVSGAFLGLGIGMLIAGTAEDLFRPLFLPVPDLWTAIGIVFFILGLVYIFFAYPH